MKFKFFSFEWLSSTERKQRQEELALKQREMDLREKELQKEEPEQLQKEFMAQVMSAPQKTHRSVRVVGSTCLVVLNDGTTLSKDDPSLLGKVRQAQSEEEIIELFTKYDKPEVKEEEKEEATLVSSNLEVLKDNPDFEIKGENVYLKGVNLAIPPVVLSSFIELLERIEAIWDSTDDGCISCDVEELEEQYEALKMFWLKLCLNGREQSRKDLLAFCHENDVRITSNGNLILYRNIVATGNKDKSYTEFISQQYFKIKGQKKSPKSYEVYKDEIGYKLVNASKNDGADEYVGNLYDLYQGLSDAVDNKFTSWNNKGKYEIKIGSLYKIEEDDIDLDNTICHSGGLVK